MRLSMIGRSAATAALLVIVLLAPTTPALLRDLRSESFPDVALAAGSLLLLGVAGWAATITAAVLLGASSGAVAAVTPAFVRDALLLGVAGALVVAPAHAEQQAPDRLAAPQTQARTEHARHTVDGLPLPDRPTIADVATVHRSAPATSAPAPRAAAAVEVRPGDTLWAIAARALPSGASDDDIADATRRWHETNRSVIGADPDLIEPRQLLTPPSGKDRP